MKRLSMENGEVRYGLENGDNGEHLLPTVDERVNGRVVHFVRSVV